MSLLAKKKKKFIHRYKNKIKVTSIEEKSHVVYNHLKHWLDLIKQTKPCSDYCNVKLAQCNEINPNELIKYESEFIYDSFKLLHN